VRGRKKSGSRAAPPGEQILTHRVRGRAAKDASFPVAPARVELPVDYGVVLADLKARLERERLRVIIAANSAMVLLYWDLGRVILDQQARGDGEPA
jgi:hypothetical protein